MFFEKKQEIIMRTSLDFVLKKKCYGKLGVYLTLVKPIVSTILDLSMLLHDILLATNIQNPELQHGWFVPPPRQLYVVCIPFGLH